MTIYKFLDYVRNNPLRFIRYCEIIIKPNGDIELANPSHSEKLLEIASELEGCDIEDIKSGIPINIDPMSYLIEKYGLIAVWYNKIMRPLNMSCLQRRSLKLLTNRYIISRYTMYTDICTEYTWVKQNPDLCVYRTPDNFENITKILKEALK